MAATVSAGALAQTAADAGWSGNFAINPGFEEDFTNRHGEGHVLSFKGDWFYNQKDRVPDFWGLEPGKFEVTEQGPQSGEKSLKLAAGQAARHSFPRAVAHEGGSSWAGPGAVDITVCKPERFNTPWRASVWVRNGGTLRLGGEKGVEAKGDGTAQWQQISVELPTDKVPAPNVAISVELMGPGEFDGVVVQEKLPATPNLLATGTFEQADKDGYPAGWSKPRKFNAIGPTYYVWTDWNHPFRAPRGAVKIDPLVVYSGKHSLRVDVPPGDEKFIESDLIQLNQAAPDVIEVSAMVAADKIKLVDLRCVDEDGVYMPAIYPSLPENSGATEGHAFGNGTFGWRQVRKFFATPHGRAVKGVRVRLATRGLNGHTLDDAGTRPYASAAGAVWWDDVKVYERTSTAAELQARGVKAAPATPAAEGVGIAEASVDLGERFFGTNTLRFDLTNTGAAGAFQLKVTVTPPGGKPATTQSQTVQIAKGARGSIEAPYEIAQLAADLEKQGTIELQLTRDGKPVAQNAYAYNTWPVIADVDLARHYNLPNENPVTTSINLGVARGTLAKTAKLELALVNAADPKKVTQALPAAADLKGAFAQTLAGLPKSAAESYEFNLPTPAWWADRTNLLVVKLDLSPLKVWPHDQPTRDTALLVRGLDSGGKVLFEDLSQPFGRTDQRPQQPAIESVEVRQDGAVLINGQPRYLTGATHQNFAARVTHTPAIIAQLGLMGHRLTQGFSNEAMEKMWKELNLYSLQAKPDPSFAGTAPVVEMNDQQKAAFQQWVAGGGMQYVVTLNTGGWEATVNTSDQTEVSKHQQTNDWVKQTAKRPLAISTSGAYNAWWLPKLPFYDINHAETEMWGPMDFNTIWTPYMERQRKSPTTWVYLPQLYDNTPHERYRFETYENIIRGSAGFSMIQGTGDATLNRGLAGEMRYLEGPLNSLEKAPAVTFEPNVSHKVTRQGKKTFILATNAGPIIMGDWKWDAAQKQNGQASHEGDTVNTQWFRPAGIRIHGFRGAPLPEKVQKGDKIVQHVWLDPKETPDWVMVAVRGDGKFVHNAVLGNFDYARFRNDYGNLVMFSELEHSVWHDVNWVFDDATYQRAIKVVGQQQADAFKKASDEYRKKVDEHIYKAADFKKAGERPAAGKWVRIELDADQYGLTGKLVDGFAYLTQNGRALWDYSVLERGGKVVRVFSDDAVGIPREQLKSVRVSVPGLKKGTKVKSLFEERTITADDGGFTDNFVGDDSYATEGGAPEGDMYGYVKDHDRELARMMPSGYGYKYGPTAVRIYEIEQ